MAQKHRSIKTKLQPKSKPQPTTCTTPQYFIIDTVLPSHVVNDCSIFTTYTLQKSSPDSFWDWNYNWRHWQHWSPCLGWQKKHYFYHSQLLACTVLAPSFSFQPVRNIPISWKSCHAFRSHSQASFSTERSSHQTQSAKVHSLYTRRRIFCPQVRHSNSSFPSSSV